MLRHGPSFRSLCIDSRDTEALEFNLGGDDGMVSASTAGIQPGSFFDVPSVARHMPRVRRHAELCWQFDRADAGPQQRWVNHRPGRPGGADQTRATTSATRTSASAAARTRTTGGTRLPAQPVASNQPHPAIATIAATSMSLSLATTEHRSLRADSEVTDTSMPPAGDTRHELESV